MADLPPEAQAKDPKTQSRSTYDFDHIVQQADEKAIKLFDLINDQTRGQIQFAVFLHRTLTIMALMVLVICIFIALSPTANPYLQAFSLIGTPTSLLTLLLVSLRNPVTQQNQAFERVLRLNVIFLDFIHRTHNSRLLLEKTLDKIGTKEFAKLYAQAKDIENIAEETLEKLNE